MFISLEELRLALDLTGWNITQEKKATKLLQDMKDNSVDWKVFTPFVLTKKDDGFIIVDGVVRALAYDSMFSDNDLFEVVIK